MINGEAAKVELTKETEEDVTLGGRVGGDVVVDLKLRLLVDMPGKNVLNEVPHELYICWSGVEGWRDSCGGLK
jgi:hypothetical protein